MPADVKGDVARRVNEELVNQKVPPVSDFILDWRMTRVICTSKSGKFIDKYKVRMIGRKYKKRQTGRTYIDSIHI
jgi:hypothetical protein